MAAVYLENDLDNSDYGHIYLLLLHSAHALLRAISKLNWRLNKKREACKALAVIYYLHNGSEPVYHREVCIETVYVNL